MRYRVKLMLGIAFLLSLALGVSGTLLITASHSAALKSEQTTAVRSYQMIQNALELVNSAGSQGGYRDVAEVLRQMDSRSGGWLGLRLSAGDTAVYKSAALTDADFYGGEAEPEDGKCSMVVFHRQKNHYLQVSGAIHVGTNTARLDALFDINTVYDSRQEQQKVYRWVFLGTMAAAAALSWLLAGMLTRPVTGLSQVARKIAAGEMDARAAVSGEDEVGRLAADFNGMADSLQDHMRQLQEAMKRQEEFMGSFAHEMKTPMTSIIGYADLMRGQSLSPEESSEAANYIFSEGKRLESLSFKLLDLLVLDQKDFELTEASPMALITGIVNVMRPRLAEKGIVLQCRCQKGSCRLEPDLFKSLLVNLIDNARKAMDGEGNILVYSGMTEDGCRIQVADNGRGMPPEAVSRVTEAFYRVDKSRSRAQGGAGLGLALCSRIVQLHGGTMQFESRLGKGTCVTVELKGGR